MQAERLPLITKERMIFLMKRTVKVILLVLMVLSICAGCGSKKKEAPDDINGTVESPDSFIKLGMYIDAEGPEVSNCVYSISKDEIAEVSFVYNGLQCVFRASTVYSEFDLAAVDNTMTGDMLSTMIGGNTATYYTLQPGRVVFFSDSKVNYSLYTYVTTTDAVLNDIINCLTFENHYNERPDVKKQTDEDAYAYAEKIMQVIKDEDVDTLSTMINYPEQLGSGQSISNEEELFKVPKEELFTEYLKGAMNQESLDNLRKTDDGSEYIMGTNYRNVHFRKNSKGEYKITRINN